MTTHVTDIISTVFIVAICFAAVIYSKVKDFVCRVYERCGEMLEAVKGKRG